LLWLFVHPERPLLDDEAGGPPAPGETGAITRVDVGASHGDGRETRQHEIDLRTGAQPENAARGYSRQESAL
jgi:hypothetical protein